MSEGLNIATTQLTEEVSTLGWASPSWDIMLILFFIVAAVVFSMSFGRRRVIVLLFSIYISLAVVNTLPYLENIFSSNWIDKLFAVKIAVFLSVFIGLFTFLNKSALLRYMRGSSQYTPSWQIMALSLLYTGLLISLTLSFLPAYLVEYLSFFTKSVFVSEGAQFFWIVAPILTLGLIKKPSKKQLEAEEESE
ncbi:hypothetical protein ISR92_00455 [Patescibacteria group bacterium]|nr:hypothetical protein [Patescibacteria group bacterium]